MTTPRKTMIQQVMPGRHLLTSQKTMVRGQKSLCQEDLRVETKANRPSIKTSSVKKSLCNISKGTLVCRGEFIYSERPSLILWRRGFLLVLKPHKLQQLTTLRLPFCTKLISQYRYLLVSGLCTFLIILWNGWWLNTFIQFQLLFHFWRVYTLH